MATQHDTSTSTSTSTSEQQSGPLSTPMAVGGGSPASSFSSPLPHAHPLNGGSVVDTFEASNQLKEIPQEVACLHIECALSGFAAHCSLQG